jgi:hypothetical protein
VAQLLAMPEGTVKTLSARALDSLRAAGLAELEEVTDVP